MSKPRGGYAPRVIYSVGAVRQLFLHQHLDPNKSRSSNHPTWTGWNEFGTLSDGSDREPRSKPGGWRPARCRHAGDSSRLGVARADKKILFGRVSDLERAVRRRGEEAAGGGRPETREAWI
jgi:hypothetical protein